MHMDKQETFGQPKTPDQLEDQLKRVEKFFGVPYASGIMREQLLSLPADKIQELFPDQYEIGRAHV